MGEDENKEEEGGESSCFMYKSLAKWDVEEGLLKPKLVEWEIS